jgi:tol-pal system protein YbgF
MFIVLAWLPGCAANQSASDDKMLQREHDRARLQTMSDALLDAQLQLDQAHEQLETLRKEKEFLAKSVIYCRKENNKLKRRIAKSEKPAVVQSNDAPREEQTRTKINAPSMTAEELYQRALISYQNKKYKHALKSLKDFLVQYPSHNLSDNAQFWIGFCYLKLDQVSAASRAFNEVLEKYPAGNKVPDSMLMMAIIEKRRGEVGKYREILTEIIRRYPKSEAADRARRKLSK